ncbi:MAG: archease [Thermoplasmata archaeon]|jgi:SHS2 domain-containing protein
MPPGSRPVPRRRYGQFPTTADVGIWARGRSPEALFEGLGLGLYALLTDRRTVRGREERRVRAEAADLPGLVVGFLTELVVRQQVEGFLARRVDVTFAPGPPPSVEARLFGEPFDPARHPAKVEVKAITFHRLDFDPARGRARVIVDI